MNVLIASRWIIPGFIFTRMTTQKIKRRELERPVKRVSKFYLPFGPEEGHKYLVYRHEKSASLISD